MGSFIAKKSAPAMALALGASIFGCVLSVIGTGIWAQELTIVPGDFRHAAQESVHAYLRSTTAMIAAGLGLLVHGVGLGAVARLKGRTASWSAMALLSVIGLIVVALLPSRYDHSKTEARS